MALESRSDGDEPCHGSVRFHIQLVARSWGGSVVPTRFAYHVKIIGSRSVIPGSDPFPWICVLYLHQ